MNTWVLVMIIFAGSSSSINHMEVLSSYTGAKACANDMKHAVTIKMSVEREFACIKIKPKKQT